MSEIPQDEWYSLTHNADGSLRKGITCPEGLEIVPAGEYATWISDPMNDKKYIEQAYRTNSYVGRCCMEICRNGCLAKQEGVMAARQRLFSSTGKFTVGKN
ncbi:MAG TPA: hypothetical protein VJL83_02580 [Patescibacteria group bacterium]|nr:hypothetical protein [Patescibacteria group bacterium]